MVDFGLVSLLWVAVRSVSCVFRLVVDVLAMLLLMFWCVLVGLVVSVLCLLVDCWYWVRCVVVDLICLLLVFMGLVMPCLLRSGVWWVCCI